MLKPAVNLNNPVRPTANLDRMSVPHTLVEASEVNGIQQLAQQHIREPGAAGIKQTTMSSVIPTKDSIIIYGHKKDSTGKLIEAAIAIKGKESSVLHLTQPTKGLFETANEASAAYARVRAGMASPTSVASGGVNAQKLSTPGGVIRADAIPTGSQLEYLAPGRVKFDGVEFRAVRDLGHLSESQLDKMYRKGINPRALDDVRLDGHHFNQQYHREPGAFVAYVPEPNHCISNKIQHPKGNSGGLEPLERKDWKALNKRMNKELARTELLRRGIIPNAK